MAHQAKSVFDYKPFSMKGEEGALEVKFEKENAEMKIKKLDPKYHMTFPLNHNFQEKYLKVRENNSRACITATKKRRGRSTSSTLRQD